MTKRFLPYFSILLISISIHAQQTVGVEVRIDPNLNIQAPVYSHTDALRNAAILKQTSKLFKTIDLKLTNVAPKVVLDTLQKIFQYPFFIESAVIQIKKKISINVRNATLLQILEKVAQQVPINYGFMGPCLIIEMKPDASTGRTSADSIKVLDEVYVKHYNDGHQEIPKEVATGSYAATDIGKYQLVNTSPNVIGRLLGISIPLSLDNSDPLTGTKPYSIRGTNSIYGNDKAITILNGFRVFNNTNFINPFDIAKITFLRDATAGALFGTTSANGAIVLNSEEGLKNDFQLSFLSRTGVQLKPGLSYGAGWNAADLINFNKTIYNNFGGSILPYNSPIRNILDRVANGSLSESAATDTFNRWGKNNFREDIRNNLYRNSWGQQYAVKLRTGSAKTKLYASGGIDDNDMPEKGNKWSRQTLTANASYTDSIFMVQINTSLANIDAKNNFVPVSTALPYWSLYDENGASRNMPYGNSPDQLNATGQTGFLPWSYNPVNEQALSNNITNQTYHSLGGKIGVNLFKGFQASFSFLLEKASYDNQINYVPGTYYANNLINRFRTVDSTGKITWNIPVGSIRDHYKANASTSQWRTEFKYTRRSKRLSFVSLGGFEKINHEIKMSGTRDYGADLGFPQSEINYQKDYPISISPGKKEKIPYMDQRKDTADHFFNFYASSYLTYNKKYTVSAIARTDLSNRFSAQLNKFGIGLWSVAGSWDLSGEKFYKNNFISHLKWRTSFGSTGNINYTILPFGTFESINDQGIIMQTHRPQAQSLTYEKLYLFNTGLDFEIKEGLLSGNIDYFRKKGARLLNYTNRNPTSGNDLVLDNSGSIKGCGVDINLTTSDLSIAKDLYYNVSLNYLYTRNEVTTDPSVSISKPAKDYTNPYAYMPRPGYPVESIFAFKSADLNPENGNPRGFLNGQPSEQYSTIVNATDGSTLYYVGPATPVSMANMCHQFQYRSFSLTCILTGKFGYYYRMEPMDYRRILLQMDDGIPGKVWQNQGDEAHTKIPSFHYPFDNDREDFSAGSTVYTIRADHIRLQTLQVAYQFNNKQLAPLHLKQLQISFAVNNAGIIYKANKFGVDPDVPVNGYKTPTSFHFTLISTY